MRRVCDYRLRRFDLDFRMQFSMANDESFEKMIPQCAFNPRLRRIGAKDERQGWSLMMLSRRRLNNTIFSSVFERFLVFRHRLSAILFLRALRFARDFRSDPQTAR